MQYNDLEMKDTICALSTPVGVGAISVVRVSGLKAISVVSTLVTTSTGNSIEFAANTVKHGFFTYKDAIIDEVVVACFKGPNSYTGQDVIEISCHGSLYIQQRILEILLESGCRLAEPGEFTIRAFYNDKIDLSQAEAIGDLIIANSKSAHDLAMKQMRGGYSNKIKELRGKLLNFTSLIELELDFSEEDVEFADRKKLSALIEDIITELEQLVKSYAMGNVLKNGIPVAIIGKPNVGKSTLLNALLNEEKAIVSEIPGTTRDVIEDTITIHGITYRFIDTAGIRHKGTDEIENIGIDKTFEKLNQAHIILYVFDVSKDTVDDLMHHLKELEEKVDGEMPTIILIGNKIDDMAEAPKHFQNLLDLETIFISAKRKININLVSDTLLSVVKDELDLHQAIIVSNVRHLDSFKKALTAMLDVEQGLNNAIPSDLLTIDIRSALDHLGSITGEVGVEDVLEHIFRHFCIGK